MPSREARPTELVCIAARGGKGPAGGGRPKPGIQSPNLTAAKRSSVLDATPVPCTGSSKRQISARLDVSRYFFALYASSSRLRSGRSSRIRRPRDVSACRRPGDCGGGKLWKRDSAATRSWKIGAGAGPGGRSQT